MSGGDENDFCDRLDGCKKKKKNIYIQSIISSYACKAKKGLRDHQSYQIVIYILISKCQLQMLSHP